MSYQKHEGHHHHYVRPSKYSERLKLDVRQTKDEHFHDDDSALSHDGNAIFGGPCECGFWGWLDEILSYQQGDHE